MLAKDRDLDILGLPTHRFCNDLQLLYLLHKRVITHDSPSHRFNPHAINIRRLQNALRSLDSFLLVMML